MSDLIGLAQHNPRKEELVRLSTIMRLRLVRGGLRQLGGLSLVKFMVVSDRKSKCVGVGFRVI